MRNFLLLIIAAVMLFPACQSEPKSLSKEQMEKEKVKVIDVIKAYNTASEKKNFGDMVETLAGEVTFFGTDSGEVIHSFDQFKETMLAQWKEYDMTRYGEISDMFIEIDPNANFASVIYGIPLYTKKGDVEENVYLRVARTLRKEKDKWVIVSGIVSIARTRNYENPTDTLSKVP